MHFDCLNKIYAMVQSNWQFDKLVWIGLISLYERSDRSAQIVQKTLIVPILGVNRHIAETSQYVRIHVHAINAVN